MKTKMTPIVSWSIWAGGLSLVMGIVTRKHLIAGFEADETGMSYIIAALFAAGLIVSFFSALKLHKEWNVLKEIARSNAIPRTENGQELAGVFSKLKGFKDRGEEVDIHTSIDTYHSKHNSRVRSVSIMAALVISMGLLGTVVGLIMSISGLGSMVENIGLSKNGMLDAMRLTFAGMGTAFYTTFFGALGGLILRAVAVSQLNSLSELCSEAAEYAAANLTANLGSKDEELNQQVSKVISSFENMQNEIDALTGRISESIEATLASFGNSIESVGEHAMESTKEVVTGMTEEMGAFGSTIKDSLTVYNEQIIKAGEETGQAIATVNEGIANSGEETAKAIASVNESIEKSGEEMTGAFGSLYDTIGKAGDGMLDSFGTLGENLGESGDKVTEAFEGLNSSVSQASDTVSGSLADFKLSIDGTALELNEAVGELHTAISQATGEMVVMAKAKLDTDATEIAGHLSLAADSIQQFLHGKKSAGSNEDSNQKVA
ncbi:MotA/TolQ/ExbB proton channel family protein [Pontiellaceae bacterium B12227]|nr:MotA/TolQ/ExbB proton channel family protein [Pontiellaceae bacterium B12227]